MNIGLAKNFGRSGAFALGLILLPHIFFPILAFSSSTEYVGGYGDIPSYGDNKDSRKSDSSESYTSKSYDSDYSEFRSEDGRTYEGDIEVVENVRSADEEPADETYSNKDEFADVFNKAKDNTIDDTEHVSGDVE